MKEEEVERKKDERRRQLEQELEEQKEKRNTEQDQRITELADNQVKQAQALGELNKQKDEFEKTTFGKFIKGVATVVKLVNPPVGEAIQAVGTFLGSAIPKITKNGASSTKKVLDNIWASVSRTK